MRGNRWCGRGGHVVRITNWRGCRERVAHVPHGGMATASHGSHSCRGGPEVSGGEADGDPQGLPIVVGALQQRGLHRGLLLLWEFLRGSRSMLPTGTLLT